MVALLAFGNGRPKCRQFTSNKESMPIAAVTSVNTSRVQPPTISTTPLAKAALQVRDFSQARENPHIKGMAAGRDVGHGNFYAVMEVLAAKIFRLTGLGCPVIKLANGYNALMRANAVDDPKSLFVASRLESSFVDLGVFL
ncbi:hypothetical protein [Glaciimonas sp. PCH181]|uniref:hypothetical protein n=1 Tax=Glaciimonas sp. PCH181 TaxID=2133943 RepID=UPI000D3754CE|nr:hypothetical protein [Glaciimonas sp. PCH181]PUA19981.1 hypothetical protein C7W93_09305 [Glaciimonas sp. PCH181]